METITDSVGKGGANRSEDIETVQGLLNRCLHLLPDSTPLEINGEADEETIRRITAFQSDVVSMERPDGRVDPGGGTLRALIENAIVVESVTNPANVDQGQRVYRFPLDFRPPESYREGMRRFGANRKHGRKHGGCDLYAPVGTPIYALDDGEVIQDAYAFYLGTQALEIRHADCIARYGEIREAASGLKQGSSVRRGQCIGYVGELQGLNMSMLHLELYSGSETGPLTQRGNSPYKRRSDLIDPTEILDNAQLT